MSVYRAVARAAERSALAKLMDRLARWWLLRSGTLVEITVETPVAYGVTSRHFRGWEER